MRPGGAPLAAQQSAQRLKEQRVVEGPAHRLGVLDTFLQCGSGSVGVTVGECQCRLGPAEAGGRGSPVPVVREMDRFPEVTSRPYTTPVDAASRTGLSRSNSPAWGVTTTPTKTRQQGDSLAVPEDRSAAAGLVPSRIPVGGSGASAARRSRRLRA